jgi:hypothetical protein
MHGSNMKGADLGEDIQIGDRPLVFVVSFKFRPVMQPTTGYSSLLEQNNSQAN